MEKKAREKSFGVTTSQKQTETITNVIIKCLGNSNSAAVYADITPKHLQRGTLNWTLHCMKNESIS